MPHLRRLAGDLRNQSLGQLAEWLNYESLYTQAVGDPELKRTRLELEAALANASEARHVVFELFQDLDRFALGDYRQFAVTSEGMGEVVRFLRAALDEDGRRLVEEGGIFAVAGDGAGRPGVRLTASREQSLATPEVELLGLDHPLVAGYVSRHRATPPEEVGLRIGAGGDRTGVLSLWHVRTQGERGEVRSTILPLAVDSSGQRVPPWERQIDAMFRRPAASDPARRLPGLLADVLEPMVQRELLHRGVIGERRGYDAKLIGWLEVV